MGKDRKTFGQLLREEREKKGITQDGLAELSRNGSDKPRLSRIQINRLENDLHEPTWKTIRLLCEILDLKCAYFMDAAQPEPTKPAPKGKKKSGK